MLQISKIFDSRDNWKEKAKQRADELRLGRKKIQQQTLRLQEQEERILKQEKRIQELEEQLKKTPDNLLIQ